MRSNRPSRPLLACTGAAGALLLAVLALTAAHGQAEAPVPLPASACFGAAARDSLHPCRNRALRLKVFPAPSAAHDEPNAPCNSFHRDGHVNICAFGVIPGLATRTIALIGDSHASVWRAPLALIARDFGWRGLSITRRSCPLSAATRLTPEPARSHCVRWVGEIPGFLRRHPEVDTLFVVALARGKVVVPPGRTETEARISGYERAWARLPATVRHIVVIRDPPRIKRADVRCIDDAIAARKPAGLACAVPRNQALAPDAQILAARRAQSPRLQVIDLTHVFCGNRSCFPVIGGALVFKDRHHLSLAFARTLAPQLAREIQRLAPSW